MNVIHTNLSGLPPVGPSYPEGFGRRVDPCVEFVDLTDYRPPTEPVYWTDTLMLVRAVCIVAERGVTSANLP